MSAANPRPWRAGDITNWILLNEIDFHPVWTNMEGQPHHIVMETRYHSLQIVHNVARFSDSRDRVFASLTHHLNVIDKENSLAPLAPRRAVEVLPRYSELEGSFATGVACYPYPQNSFAEVTWEDTNIQDRCEISLMESEEEIVKGLPRP